MNVIDLDLSKMAEEVIGSMKNFEPERKIEITIDPDLSCRGDVKLMRVVLENLLSNAWKYTRKTDNPKVRFSCVETKGVKTFFVQDNGAGFDSKNSNKLFHAFERLHSDKVFEGLGIGLSTAKKIIQRHGGEVLAEGKIGEGATFFFTVANDM